MKKVICFLMVALGMALALKAEIVVAPASTDANSAWCKRLAEKKKLIEAGGAPIVFIGDMCASWFEREYVGRTTWNKYFAQGKYRALNLGFDGDGIGNILWRIKNGALDGYEAKVVVFMGLRNGIPGQADETAKGIIQILEKIRAKQPKAKIVYAPSFPRNHKPTDRGRVFDNRVADGVKKYAAENNVLVCDITKKLLFQDGTLSHQIAANHYFQQPIVYQIFANEFLKVIEDSFSEKLDARVLRGYGEMSAVREGNRASVKAESAEKARLWIARFLYVYRQYAIKPGVVKFPNGGGFVAVSREGDKVYFDYSKNEPESKLNESLVKIPNYLNVWDDTSFKFYYRLGMRPKNVKAYEYDYEKEFDFIKECEGTGVVLWMNPHCGDYSLGFSDENEWNWAKRLADERGINVALNTNIGAGGHEVVASKYADEIQERMPQFLGSFHAIGDPHHGGEMFRAWSSENLRRESLQVLCDTLKKYNTDNVTDILEPHGELHHGKYTLMTEFGPLADKSFREYLKGKYETCAAVAKRWKDESVKAWNDVRVPEVVEFAGWGKNAVDLSGEWRGRYLAPKNADEKFTNKFAPHLGMPQPEEVKPEWVAENVDDKDWPLHFRHLPGSDENFFVNKNPAFVRRTFDLKKKFAGKTYLYLWDLSNQKAQKVCVWLNGKKAAEDFVRFNTPHWMVADVTEFLREGKNSIALQLPNAMIAYRIYLTDKKPAAYPFFGEGLNAKWVDFCAWNEWIRGKDLEMGMKMLRKVEPDKTCVSMAPAHYANTIREMAKKYGTRFHDTGGTGAFWFELLPMLMQSADMPFTVEPGAPAQDLDGFKRLFSLYMKTGINAIHYFIHVGNIMWNDEIRNEFKRILPAIRMMGKMEKPRSEIALVHDSRMSSLMGYPWRNDLNSAYVSDYVSWSWNGAWKLRYQLDAITPHDLHDGNAWRYKYLIDANNTVMFDEDVEEIEKYVRDGGTYVAMFQSGRHGAIEPEKQMLKSLTGCECVEIMGYNWKPDENGTPRKVPDTQWELNYVTNGLLVPGSVNKQNFRMRTTGAKFKAIADDVKVIAKWSDGSIAVAYRNVGKGRVVLFGVCPPAMYATHESQLLGDVMCAMGAKEIPLGLVGNNSAKFHPRHYVTTDGLKDVWLLTGSLRPGVTNDYEFAWRDGKERVLTNVITGERVEKKGKLVDDEFILATSDRGAPELAAWRWIGNQYGWWRGAEGRDAKDEPRMVHDDQVFDLSDGWLVTDGTSRVVRALGPAIVGKDFAPVDYTCTRKVTVPKAWKGGTVELWGAGMYPHQLVRTHLKVFLNGRELRRNGDGLPGIELPLKAGETGELTLEVRGDRDVKIRGFAGNVYLFHRPDAVREFSLAGEWQKCEYPTDPVREKVTLPGKIGETYMLYRTFTMPKLEKGERVRMDYETVGANFTGVIVNGKYIRRHHHYFGNRTWIDITKYVKQGMENEIFICYAHTEKFRAAVKSVKLSFYK